MKNPKISEKSANARFKNGSTIPVVNVETGKIYRSINQAAKDCGISKSSNIGEVLKGKRHSAGGYHWRFATKEEINTI